MKGGLHDGVVVDGVVGDGVLSRRIIRKRNTYKILLCMNQAAIKESAPLTLYGLNVI